MHQLELQLQQDSGSVLSGMCRQRAAALPVASMLVCQNLKSRQQHAHHSLFLSLPHAHTRIIMHHTLSMFQEAAVLSKTHTTTLAPAMNTPQTLTPYHAS